MLKETSKIVFEETTCPICGKSEYQHLRYVHSFQGHNCYLVRCIDCNFMYRNPRPTENSMYILYENEYFESDHHCGTIFSKLSYYEFGQYVQERNIKRLKWIEKNIDAFLIKTKNLLEVGCAAGYFLKIAQENGWNCLGIEINEVMSDYGKEKLGLSILTGTIEKAESNLPHNHFDLIYMQDVLEHLPDLRSSLSIVYKLLHQHGYVVIDIPIMTNAFPFRFHNIYLKLKNIEYSVEKPLFHLYEFTPESIQTLLKNLGFHIICMKEYHSKPCELLIPDGPKWAKFTYRNILYVNFLLTTLIHSFGDRLIVIASPCKKEG